MSTRRARTFRQPTGKPVLISARDVEIFKLLNRYRFLRSTYLCAFFPKSDATNLLKRLGTLYHEQPYLNRPERQYSYANALYLPAVYEIDALARQVLKYHGISPVMADCQAGRTGDSRHFAHALMICDVLASIELGSKERSVRFVAWEEILAKAPCRELEDPFRISVTFTHNGKRQTIGVVPDGMFGLEYLQNGEKSYRFFALEADRQTMPIFRGNLTQTSYHRKVLAYREILTQEIHKKHFGVPNLFILNVTTSAERMGHMIEALKQITGGRGNSVFLFKTMKGDLFKAPPADAHMMIEPWFRAGYPAFNISAARGE